MMALALLVLGSAHAASCTGRTYRLPVDVQVLAVVVAVAVVVDILFFGLLGEGVVW